MQVLPQPVVLSHSVLAQRVRELLRLLPVNTLHGRVLLVDANEEQRRFVRHQGTHLIQVNQHAAAWPAPQSASTSIATQLYQDSLLPRVALALATGRFISAAPSERAAYVAMEDAAMVTALVLTAEEIQGEPLLLTGPSAFHHRELCAMISRLFNRQILIETVRSEQLEQTLLTHGLSADEAALSVRIDSDLRATQAVVSADVARITGMLPLSMRSLLMRERKALLERASQLSRPRPKLASALRPYAQHRERRLDVH